MRPLSSVSSRSTVTPVRNSTFGYLSASASPTLSASSLPPVVSGNASQGVAARGEPPVEIDAKGKVCRMQPGGREPFAKVRDLGLIGNGWEGIGAGMLGLRRVMAQRATYPVERLGLLVPRLDLRVGQGPAGAVAAHVTAGCEILGAIAHQHGAVELRVPADAGIVAGVEALAFRRQPCLLGTVMAAREDRLRVARLGRVAQAFAPSRGSGCAGRRAPSAAASVAPPMPDPTMTTSASVTSVPSPGSRAHLPYAGYWIVPITKRTRPAKAFSAPPQMMRSSVSGSNRTALSMFTAKSKLWPGCTSASARMRAMQSFPDSVMVTKRVGARGLRHADDIRKRLDVPGVPVRAFGIGDRLGPDAEGHGPVAIKPRKRAGAFSILRARSEPSEPVRIA